MIGEDEKDEDDGEDVEDVGDGEDETDEENDQMIQHLLCSALEKDGMGALHDHDAWPVATLTKIMTLMAIIVVMRMFEDDDDFSDHDENDCVTDRWHSRSTEGRSPAQRNPQPDTKPVFSFKEFSLSCDHWVIIGFSLGDHWVFIG